MTKDVRLTPFQAAKVWDGMFATRWAEIGQGHPLRSLMEKLAARGYGGSEVQRWIATGQLDVRQGMPSGAVPVSRVQEAPEDNEVGVRPDYQLLERAHQVAATTANSPGGGVTAGSF